MPRRRLILEWLAVLLISVLGSGCFIYSSLGEKGDNLLFDNAVSWRTPDPDDRIIIVEIDTDSLATMGRWPWSRDIHAKLIERIAEAGPRAIGYDVIFSEPADARDDQHLVTALKAAGTVVLPNYRELGLNGQAYAVVKPLPMIEAAARATGYVNVQFDSDGLVRRSLVTPVAGAGPTPHMMEAVARVVTGHETRFSARQAHGDTRPLLIPFHSAGAYRHISAGQLINGEIPATFMKDKIVLVGATAPGLGDLLAVPGPAGGTMSGIEVQANLLTALIQDYGVRSVSEAVRFGCAVLLMILTLGLYWWVRPATALYFTVGAAILILLTAASALMLGNLWFAPGGLLVGLSLAYPLWSWRRLAALNSFVETETRSLSTTLALSGGGPDGLHGLDSVSAAAVALKSVIGALSDMKRFMGSVIEDAPDALCVIDYQGHVQLANAAAHKILGVNCEGQPLAPLLERIAPGATERAAEVHLPDGRTFLFKSVPLGHDENAVQGSILRMADITDRRLIEKEREDMLAFLSHDMRSPQAAIITLLDQPVSGTVTQRDQRIRAQAEASLKLADNFVQLARLSHIEPTREPVDLAALLHEAIDGSFAKAAAKSVTVERPKDDGTAWIDGDGWMILRALNNILDNAIRYSPEGGKVRCDVAVAPDGNLVSLSIADQGPGLSSERKEALFEPFGSVDKSASHSAGLGLSFVKKVIDLHGAAISCQSNDQGTCFTLTFRPVPE